MQSTGSNRTILIIVGVLVGICLCVCVIGGAVFAITGGGIAAVFNALAAPAAVKDQFLNGLAAEDYDTAYGLMDRSLQDYFGSPDDLGSLLAGDGIVFDSFSTHSSNINNDVATFEGELSLEGGGSTLYSVDVLSDGGSWLITDFSYDLP